MPYRKYEMPSYPCAADLWDRLGNESRPIVVYGMGNGADKLFMRLEKYGVTPSDVFASDGFVRGHSYRGMRVLSFSEVKNKYKDFVIVLSFASAREEVLEMLRSVDSEHEMYIPDMPVAGEEYFDREFYNAHYEELCAARDSLADEESKNAFCAILNYKLTGKMKYLEDAYSSKDELYELIGTDVKRYMDIGAYNGDTLREARLFFPGMCEAVAVEPDPKTFKRLERYASTLVGIDIRTVNAAAWDSDGEGSFISSSNRNSSVNSTSSYEHRDTAVRLVAPDSIGFEPDYIKYDVEGAELWALRGSQKMIESCRPTLLVSLYHRSADIFSLTNYLREKYPFYRIYLRRTRCVPAWEIALILKAT